MTVEADTGAERIATDPGHVTAVPGKIIQINIKILTCSRGYGDYITYLLICSVLTVFVLDPTQNATKNWTVFNPDPTQNATKSLRVFIFFCSVYGSVAAYVLVP